MDEAVIALIVGGIITALAVVYGLQVIASINQQIESINRLKKRIRRMKNEPRNPDRPAGRRP